MMLTAGEGSALALSVRVGLVCVLLALPVAVALGWILARRTFPGRAILDAFIHLPLVLPPVVVGYLLLVSLGRNGVPGRWLHAIGIEVAFTPLAAVIASAVMALPLMVRAVRLAIELVDPRLEDAARTLGAGPWRVFATITLPLAFPGVLTAAVLGFARSLGEFGATILFAGNIAGETRTLPLAIFTEVQRPGGEAGAARLVVLAVLLSFAALLASEVLARRARARLGGVA